VAKLRANSYVGESNAAPTCQHAFSSARRAYMPAYVSIRQHTSAYVSIRDTYGGESHAGCALQSSRRRQTGPLHTRSSSGICTFVLVKQVNCEELRVNKTAKRPPAYTHLLRRQYLYFCTSKASKLCGYPGAGKPPPCSSSCVRTTFTCSDSSGVSAFVSIRQHPSAYASIRQYCYTAAAPPVSVLEYSGTSKQIILYQ